jgi:signal transduction histidine kinase
LLVSVRDTGKGMAPNALARLFDRHWQSTQRHGTGHGLGLAISKAIVEAHGGTISAQSALGEGTTVSFTLPSIVL